MKLVSSSIASFILYFKASNRLTTTAEAAAAAAIVLIGNVLVRADHELVVEHVDPAASELVLVAVFGHLLEYAEQLEELGHNFCNRLLNLRVHGRLMEERGRERHVDILHAEGAIFEFQAGANVVVCGHAGVEELVGRLAHGLENVAVDAHELDLTGGQAAVVANSIENRGHGFLEIMIGKFCDLVQTVCGEVQRLRWRRLMRVWLRLCSGESGIP